MNKASSIILIGALLCSVGAAQEQPGGKSRSGGAKWNVAIVIYNKMELLDFAGPAEVFQAADRGRAFQVYTVAESLDPIVSQGFVKIIPQYSISTCPPPDLVVIPGGNTVALRKSKRMMDWVKERSQDARKIFSVCTGAFVLAQTGLLDGLEATTHHGAIDALRRDYPKITVRSDRRVVDNGKIVTAAGVSAGIDGALYIVAQKCGAEVARQTATYMEYRWEPGALDRPVSETTK